MSKTKHVSVTNHGITAGEGPGANGSSHGRTSNTQASNHLDVQQIFSAGIWQD
ncbi:MAG: hypothetical protein Q8K91_10455 [Hylemonella sp.]|nr:hypothetical protein [Hylemonella sp.]